MYCCPVANAKEGWVIMRLSLRMAAFIAAILTVLVAEALLAGRARLAADDCITKPDAAPPSGHHWYYRTDRTTQRQCWYLRPEAEKARADAHQPAAAAQAPIAPKPVSGLAPESFEAGAVDISVIEKKAAEDAAPVTLDSAERIGSGNPKQSMANGVLADAGMADVVIKKPADAHLGKEISEVSMAGLSDQVTTGRPVESEITTERPFEYEITFANLAILAAVLVLVAIIIRTTLRRSAARRCRQTEFNGRREPTLGGHARPMMDPVAPLLRDTAEIEASVRLLLRELQLRQRHPDGLQPSSCKVATAGN
jgi:hypothetical protein